MGMYDYVICRYPLPTTQPDFCSDGHQYQSKSLGCQMDLYEIRDDGSLWVEEYDIEDQSDRAKWKAEHPGKEIPKEMEDDPLSGLAGCMSRVNKRWVQQQFHGTLEFYDGNSVASAFGMSFTRDGEDREWVTYEATFVNGVVSEIKETERTREVALSSDLYRQADAEVDKDAPIINETEPEVGATLWRLWGGFDGRVYPVTLIAKTEIQWALQDAKGRIETEYPSQFGNILFATESDAQTAKRWRKESWERKTQWCDDRLAEKYKRLPSHSSTLTSASLPSLQGAKVSL